MAPPVTKEQTLIDPLIKKRLEIGLLSRGVNDAVVTITPVTIYHPNLLGLISEVKVSGKNENNEDIEYNWIMKTATLAEVVRKYAQIDRLFKKEIYVYEKVIPTFTAMEQENGIFEAFAVTPKLHLYFTDTYQETLVMNDMKFDGFTPVDCSEPASYHHVVLAMKTFGKFHALSYAFRERRPEDFKKLTEHAKSRFNLNVSPELYGKHQKMCCERVLEAFNRNDRTLIHTFKRFMEKSFDYQMQAMKMGAMGVYAVLTHGDAVMDNMLFKYGDPNKPHIPTEACLLDWQFCRFGSPAFDLSQFLFLATNKKFRDEHFAEMIRTYYYSLCIHLTELNCDAEKILPFDILQLQLKRYSVYGLCMTIMMLHILMGDGANRKNWKGHMDSEDIEATFKSSVQNTDAYRARIRDVIVDYNEYGYFEFLN